MILGLSGKKGVGKTTLAEFLVRQHRFQKLSFATKLKSLSKTMFPFSEEDINGDRKETKFNKYDWTPRDFMEKFGEFMRYWEKDYWLNPIKDVMQYNPNRNIVVDDVRYINEAEYVRNLGGIILRINRYPSQNPYIQDEKSLSENSLNEYKFDFTIDEFDNVSLMDLYNAGEKILFRINK